MMLVNNGEELACNFIQINPDRTVGIVCPGERKIVNDLGEKVT